MRTIKKILLSLASLSLAITLTLIVDLSLSYYNIQFHHAGKEKISNLHETDSRLGWKVKPNTKAVHRFGSKQTVEYITDEHGFKKTESPGSYKKTIFFFGDSFTFGHRVRNRDTFTSHLAKHLFEKNIRVINAGVLAYGITQIYGRFLESKSLIRKGDVVVFSLISSDLVRELQFSDFAYWLRNTGAIEVKYYPEVIDGKIQPSPVNSSLNNFLFYFRNGPIMSRLINLFDPRDKVAYQKYANKIFKRVESICKSKGADFHIVFIPELYEISTGEYVEEIRDVKNAQNLIPFFKDVENIDSLYFPKDLHMNALGHKALSEVMIKVLEEKGAI